MEDVHRGPGRKIIHSKGLRILSFLRTENTKCRYDKSQVWNYLLLLAFKDGGDQLSSSGCRTRCKQLNMKKDLGCLLGRMLPLMITKPWNGLLSHEIFRLCFIYLCFIEQAWPTCQTWYGYVYPVSVQKYGKKWCLEVYYSMQFWGTN